MVRRLVLAMLLVQPTLGFIARNTFAPEGRLGANGRDIWLTAQIACTAGQKVSIEATITQGHPASPALARGMKETTCKPVDLEDPEAFQEVRVQATAATAFGSTTFEPGEVEVNGLAVTRDGEAVTDVRQWRPSHYLRGDVKLVTGE